MKAEKKLSVAQRNPSRKKKGSANRRKAKAAKAGKVVELVDARYTYREVLIMWYNGP